MIQESVCQTINIKCIKAKQNGKWKKENLIKSNKTKFSVT